MNTPLYDFSPALRLLVLGGGLAVLPFAWIWFRRGPQHLAQRWHAVAVLTLFLTFDLVVFGAFTRLTDSGLGCPDWPGCYGSTSPLGAQVHIQAAETAMPSGPVTQGKAWIEMIHRYFATSLGGVITLTMLAAWWNRCRGKPDGPSPLWATMCFAWVCLQGLFGALTVTMKLYPAIVTLHLLGGYLGLVLLSAQVQTASPERVRLTSALHVSAWALFALLVVQSALGGWVSTNYAVLACSDFPHCQGSWWPTMDFANGFSVVRDLGMTSDGRLLPFEALTAIHYTHRLTAYVVLAGLFGFAWALMRRPESTLRRFGLATLLLGLWQLASGLSNVVLGWPLAAALAHTAGAGAAIVLLTTLLVKARGGAQNESSDQAHDHSQKHGGQRVVQQHGQHR